jgi:deoxyribonuclease (pyrimidine dimer)
MRKMTRLNLVPPEELADQHLFAEFREIKMVPRSLVRSLHSRGLDGVVKMVPLEFTLNKGHVSFFYDKGIYLMRRVGLLRQACLDRGFKILPTSSDVWDVYHHFPSLCQDYVPTPEAFAIIRERIAQRIALKPEWYRWSNR